MIWMDINNLRELEDVKIIETGTPDHLSIKISLRNISKPKAEEVKEGRIENKLVWDNYKFDGYVEILQDKDIETEVGTEP